MTYLSRKSARFKSEKSGTKITNPVNDKPENDEDSEFSGSVKLRKHFNEHFKIAHETVNHRCAIVIRNLADRKQKEQVAEPSVLWDRIPPIVENKDGYLEVVHLLVDEGLLDDGFKSMPKSRFGCRQILLGVIYLMHDNRYFVPNYRNRNGKLVRLTPPLVIKEMSRHWNIIRPDKVPDPPDQLIKRALGVSERLKNICKESGRLPTTKPPRGSRPQRE